MLTQSTLINPKEEISNQQVIMNILSKMKKEVPVHTDHTDDYGPHRFCNECGIELVDVYDSMDNEPIWMHPESDCAITEVVDIDDMNAGSFSHDNMTMDDLRNVYKLGMGKKEYHHNNHKLVKGNWLKDNAKVLKSIYNYVDVNDEDPETGSKVYTKARFNEEVNDDEGNTIVNETCATDVGISCEEKTHESFARLCFWEKMVWKIGHCPEVAYDVAISRMHNDPNEDVVHEEEVMWVDYVTGGIRNNNMMRFAQHQMMTTKKFIKNNPMFYVPKPTKEELEDKKFDLVTMSVEPSAKYEKYVTLSFFLYGEKMCIMKGKTATNWLNPYYLDHKTLNEAVSWARKELSSK